MRKRKPVAVVVPSSSSDEDRRPLRPSKSASAAGKKPRGRAPVTASGSRLHESSREVAAVELCGISEDFCECVKDFHIASGFRFEGNRELWVDKHKPRSLEDLAVHKKKVEEVKKWMEDRLKMKKEECSGNCTLLITGPAGVGKSAAVHVIASHLGTELCEWTTPMPTLWHEHIHNSSLGLCYTSKLDEFESFIEKTRKYSMICPSCPGGFKRPAILLIDDLPLTNGRTAFVRLCKCLTSLAYSTQVPTIILLTDNCKTEYGDRSTHYSEELENSLSNSGAYKVIWLFRDLVSTSTKACLVGFPRNEKCPLMVVFNPITVNSIKKVLSRICQQEGYDVAVDLMEYIAKSSGGDIRNAIASLQYCCLRPVNCFSFHLERGLPSNIKSENSNALSFSSVTGNDGANSAVDLPFGRDETLTLYHALGKFLHNKRETIDKSTMGPDTILLKDSLARKPLKMDVPEKVLSQANGQARAIADFLHENVVDFISDEAIDDACLVISYLCEADFLLANTWHPSYLRWTETAELEGFTQSIAASVAARGVLFANSHPLHSRWHTIRKPRLWQIEQSMWHNRNQIQKEMREMFSCDLSEIATEYRPRIRWLGSRTSSEHDHAHQVPLLLPVKGEHSTDQIGPDVLIGDSSSENEEDEIEDC